MHAPSVGVTLKYKNIGWDTSPPCSLSAEPMVQTTRQAVPGYWIGSTSSVCEGRPRASSTAVSVCPCVSPRRAAELTRGDRVCMTSSGQRWPLSVVQCRHRRLQAQVCRRQCRVTSQSGHRAVGVERVCFWCDSGV